MKPTIVVCGHGPGISEAVARRFGREGFRVAIVARNAERLARAAADLGAADIEARAFPCDLADASAVRAMIEQVRGAFGGISVVHSNAYAFGAGDLATAPVEELRHIFDVAVGSLVTLAQAALPDLKAQKGAVLVTNGGLGMPDAGAEAMATQYKIMGLGVGNAARHKTVRLLHKRLADDGVYVGEVMVMGTVKGTVFDQGQGGLDPAAIAERFWQLYKGRSELSVTFGG